MQVDNMMFLHKCLIHNILVENMMFLHKSLKFHMLADNMMSLRKSLKFHMQVEGYILQASLVMFRRRAVLCIVLDNQHILNTKVVSLF